MSGEAGRLRRAAADAEAWALWADGPEADALRAAARAALDAADEIDGALPLGIAVGA